MAADAEPIEILLHLPLLAEDKVSIAHLHVHLLTQFHPTNSLCLPVLSRYLKPDTQLPPDAVTPLMS